MKRGGTSKIDVSTTNTTLLLPCSELGATTDQPQRCEDILQQQAALLASPLKGRPAKRAMLEVQRQQAATANAEAAAAAESRRRNAEREAPGGSDWRELTLGRPVLGAPVPHQGRSCLKLG